MSLGGLLCHRLGKQLLPHIILSCSIKKSDIDACGNETLSAMGKPYYDNLLYHFKKKSL